MKITSKNGNGNKVHIYIDEKYTLTLFDDYWYRLNFRDGDDIDEDTLAELQREADFRLAFEKGLSALERRAYAEKELFMKLRQKYGDEPSERAVKKLSDMGYINDESFAEDFAAYLFEKKQYDIKRIDYELKMKGITPETVSKTLKTLDNNPIPRIIVMLRSRFNETSPEEKEAKRFINRLLSKGFSFHDIRAAFSECGFSVPNGK